MKCMYCGAALEGNDPSSANCENCEILWQEDMKNRHYPDGFVYQPSLEKAGKEQIMLHHWKELKLNSRETRELIEKGSTSTGDQWSLDRLTKKQSKIIDDINLWNRIRVKDLSTPPLDTSKVHIY